MPIIHPTAIISPHAQLAPDVSVGPYAVIDGPVSVGPGCTLHPACRIMGPLTIGARNQVHTGAVLGGWPQDRKFNPEHFSETIIGDDNIFRENVTIHRGTGLNTKTILGHRNFFMVNSHVGHNCTVGNDVTLVNSAVMAGHSHIGDRAILGGFCGLHQFCRIGRLAMITQSVMNVDFPPFFLTMSTNTVHHLNAVGLRRSGMPRESINALRKMFQIAFRENSHKPLLVALKALPPEILAVPEVQEVITFCESAKRGVARYVPWSEKPAPSAGRDAETIEN